MQLNQGDFRLHPLNEWVLDLCDDLMFPLAEKGNYRYKFKSWETLELAVDEFLIALEAELETPDVA
ncbi:hypothetical protein IQ250_24340 [Pseudanabaenaceae cyanobacterium LEGE 13415]|nr:hypothetical protein [Pseudanabaenaceae cyanobacterium LEGE 13415]